MNKEHLWGYRFILYLQETVKYLRYILTGHFVIVLVFLAGWGAFEYQKWLDVVASDFPASIVAASVLSVLLFWSPIQTFLRDPDAVFLTPLESRMPSYMAKSTLFSAVWQSIVVGFVYIAFLPLLRAVVGNGFSFWTGLILILFLKGFHLLLRLFEHYSRTPWEWFSYRILLLGCSMASFLILFEEVSRYYFAFGLLGFLFIIFLFYLRKIWKVQALPWLKLIENDKRSRNRFYRFANLFTDVPHMQDRVVERKWLSALLLKNHGKNEQVLEFLFMRTFIRANDYIGLLIRLTIIATLILIFTNPGMWTILVVLLSLYLVGFQLLPFAKHHEFQIWLDIYPIQQAQIKHASISIIRKALFLQNIYLACIALLFVEWRVGIMSFFAGMAFLLPFLEYVKRKM